MPIKGVYKKPKQPEAPTLSGSIDSVIQTVNELHSTKNEVINVINDKINEVDKELSTRVKQLDDKISEVTDTIKQAESYAIQMITDIQSIPQLQGADGEDGMDADEEKIIEEVLKKIPAPEKVDIKAISSEVLKNIPESKPSLKIIQEAIDPQTIIDKIANLEDKKQLKLTVDDIAGLSKSIETSVSRSKQYLHGGGDTVVAGTNITIDTLSNGTKRINSTGGGGTPGGSNTQLQYNNNGSFGGISGATTNGTAVTYTTTNLLAADIKASGSGGFSILSNNGTTTALFGAGGGANSTFYGGLKADYATASTIAIFDASKNLISADTATYPDLTELSYVKGVTSSIQTQLNAKESALTFSTGLTRTSNTITNNLSTGVSGGQSVYGGTGSGDNLVLQSTTNATRGNVVIDTATGGFNFRDYLSNIWAIYPRSNTTAGSDGFYLAGFGTNSTFFGSGGAADIYMYVGSNNRTRLNSTNYAVAVNTVIGGLNDTASSKLEVRTNSLGTTQTTSSGLALTNTTAAAAGAQQISPAIRFTGNGWKTNTTAASQSVDFRNYLLPVQGFATPSSKLVWESSINGGAYTEVMGITSAGALSISGNISSGSTSFSISSNGDSSYSSSSTTRITANASASTFAVVNTGLTSLTGQSLTGSSAIGLFELSQTWNTSGSPTAISLNITNTASGASAKLLNLKVGGTSMFNVDTSGNATTSGKVIAGGVVRLKSYTVATLPAGTVGDCAYCTDLLLPTYMAVATGGGTVVGKVFYDGTNWITQ